MSQKVKQIIISVVVILVALIAFKVFFVDEDSGSSALVAENANATFIDGQAILSMLNNLNRVTLDESVFSDKVFLSLESFERDLDSQVLGRPNPFYPIGQDGSGMIIPVGTSTLRIK